MTKSSTKITVWERMKIHLSRRREDYPISEAYSKNGFPREIMSVITFTSEYGFHEVIASKLIMCRRIIERTEAREFIFEISQLK